MFLKLPNTDVETPLNRRMIDYVTQRQRIAYNQTYTSGEELLQDSRNLINLDELIYLIVNYSKQTQMRIDRFELATILWFLVYKDLLHGNRFIASNVYGYEFDSNPAHGKFDILSQTVQATYPTRKYTTHIGHIRPICTSLTNPNGVKDKNVAEHYLKPIYNYYKNHCDATFEEYADFKGVRLVVKYKASTHNYGLPLRSWLENNLALAMDLMKWPNLDMLDTAAIINNYANNESQNTPLQGPKTVRGFSAKELRTLSALARHGEDLEKIIKFLNI